MTLAVEGLAIAGAQALRGQPTLPGDKSISHRALMLGLLAEGRTSIRAASEGQDVRSTRAIVEALGARLTESSSPDADAARLLIVDSPGIDRLRRPPAELDCGNSGTTLRLFAGILAGEPFESVLDGDASLRRRPMERIVEPLRAMGATIAGEDGRPPVRIRGRRPLRPIEWTPPVASAQVKSAILLAGLRAEGVTRVHEPIATRDHTERMLRACGVTVRTTGTASNGQTIEIEGGQRVLARDVIVPGDVSAAAFWLVAGASHPDADLSLHGVGVNPARRAAIDILREMGARIEESAILDEDPDLDREPVANLRVRSSDLRGLDVDARRCAAAIDEIPALCVAATQARGVTTFRGVGELRVKESDRLAGIANGLAAFGAEVSIDGDDVRVAGPSALRGANVDGLGDHRLVMAFAIAALLASGLTSINGAASAAISDPGFLAELERIRS